MRLVKGTPVKLKTFLGTLKPETKVNEAENYWKLIGERGKITEEGKDGMVLVLFDDNNSIWTKKSDLELDFFSIHREKMKKEISERISFMSNTKWFKFFSKVEKKQLKISLAKVKFLLNDNKFKFDFSAFNKTGFDDVGAVGPFYFDEIEWISVPKRREIERWNRTEKLASEVVFQPIDEIENILNCLGKFEYDKSDDELIIYGYK